MHHSLQGPLGAWLVRRFEAHARQKFAQPLGDLVYAPHPVVDEEGLSTTRDLRSMACFTSSSS